MNDRMVYRIHVLVDKVVPEKTKNSTSYAVLSAYEVKNFFAEFCSLLCPYYGMTKEISRKEE